MSPVLFELFGFEVRWYSVLILLGVFVAYRLIIGEAKRFHIKEDFVFNMIFWALIIGILGARIYYVIFEWDYYIMYPSEIYKIWHGGLAIHGGILAGAITIIVYCKKYKADIKKIFDIIAPGLIIAQAIGRWGNFFNGEAFGSAVSYQTLANMKFVPQFVIDNMYINGSYHLPMFYFESIVCVVGFIILLLIRRAKYIKKGQVSGFYFIWYGAFRIAIEVFRTDSLMMFGVKTAYLACGLMIFIGIYLIASQARKPKLDDLYNSFDEIIKY